MNKYGVYINTYVRKSNYVSLPKHTVPDHSQRHNVT